MVSAITNTYISDLPDWQKTNLALFDTIIHECAPNITEAIKWGVPVFILNGAMVFSMAAFKAHTKYNFIGNGALLNDAHALFNNGLESKKSRSIDLAEGDEINATYLKQLVQHAIDTL